MENGDGWSSTDEEEVIQEQKPVGPPKLAKPESMFKGKELKSNVNNRYTLLHNPDNKDAELERFSSDNELEEFDRLERMERDNIGNSKKDGGTKKYGKSKKRHSKSKKRHSKSKKRHSKSKKRHSKSKKRHKTKKYKNKKR